MKIPNTANASTRRALLHCAIGYCVGVGLVPVAAIVYSLLRNRDFDLEQKPDLIWFYLDLGVFWFAQIVCSFFVWRSHFLSMYVRIILIVATFPLLRFVTMFAYFFLWGVGLEDV